MTARLLRGVVRTGDPVRPIATSLLVRDGLVAALDVDRADCPAGTEVTDLGAGTLWPGFVDAHVHPLAGGLQMLGHRVDPTDPPELWTKQLRELHAQTEGGAWLVVSGHSAAAAARADLDRTDLDAAAPGRPVLMVDSDLHGALASTAALEAAHGALATSPGVTRDASGRATGVLGEEAIGAVLNCAPPPTPTQAAAALATAQAHLHSLGVVGWQDAAVRNHHLGIDPGPVHLDLARQGRLTARVTAAMLWDRERGLEQLDELPAYRDALAPAIPAPTVKFLVDGVHEAGTAAMLHPYCDAHGDPLGHDGGSLMECDALVEAVCAVDALGFDVHLHALGDRAVRSSLDAVEAARTRNGHHGTRAQIAHVTFATADDVDRFAPLDVTLGLQAVWVADDFLDFAQYRRYVGDGAMRTMSRLADWARRVPHWALGSDWPVSTADPLDALRAATGRALSGDRAAQFDHQVLTLEHAFAAATAGAARAARLDGSGVLRVGAPADLVVLDVDPFTAGGLAHARVLETVVGGQVVHRTP